MGCQFGCQVDGGGTIRSADDTDGCRFQDVESQQDRPDECGEDAELRGCPQKDQLWIGDQGCKIRHGTDPKEDQRWIDAFADTEIEIVQYASGIVHSKALFRNPRQISQHHSETDWHQ